jgi:hypothetical protein
MSALSPGSLSHLAADSEPSAGASIAEAREALAFWSARVSQLPWHRRGARREARMMVSRWRARLACAHLERWRLGWLVLALAPLLQTLGHSRREHARRLLLLLRRTAVGRWALVAAAALVVASLASLALFAALASQQLAL